ncbi:MAG: TnpV protein [Erysipelotrichaceae bacterium]|nr:TnpV protein [Erysipelotrichaceae bacterium]
MQDNYRELTRFGILRKQYLKEQYPSFYVQLLIKNELDNHIQKIDEKANAMYELLIIQYKNKWNINNELKEKDPTKWMQEMNYIRHCAEEIVLNDIIYS